MSLFILFIYSLPCPFLFAHTNFGKHVELSWFPVLLKFVVWLTSFPRWRCFHRAILSSSLAFLWPYLNLLSNSTLRSRLVKCNTIYSRISENTSLVNRRDRLFSSPDKLHCVRLPVHFPLLFSIDVFSMQS